MAGLRIEGATSANIVEVDADNAMKVNFGKNTAYTGYGIIMSEKDPGTVTGSPYLLSPEASEDYRLRVGLDTILLSETFNYSTQDFGKWLHLVSGAGTNTFSLGFINISPIATTVNIGAMIKSCRTFPILGASQTYFEWTAAYTQGHGANNIMELGIGIPGTAIAALGDGVVFRWGSDGTLKGFLNYNGTETQTGVMALPLPNTTHKYALSISQRVVEFWIDDVLYAEVDCPAALGSVCASAALPTIARCYNAASIPSYIQVLKVSDCTVSMGDWAMSKPWAHQMAGAGNNAVQGAAGFVNTSGSANFVNSVGPTTIVISNAGTAFYPTLGGSFQFAPIVSGETDYVVFAYLVPAATAGLTGRSLYITGVAIDTWNTVVPVATTPTVMQWSLGIGSTAVTLATVDGAGTKATRRMHLGVQFWATGSIVGQPATPIVKSFDTPFVVNAGEYMHTIVKLPLSTATATELFRGVVGINGYWE